MEPRAITTHSSILAWEILWTEELSRLHSMRLHELDMTEQLNNNKTSSRDEALTPT